MVGPIPIYHACHSKCIDFELLELLIIFYLEFNFWILVLSKSDD